ncbi:MAG: helix-turn-helix transcriptional regulator [Prevotella sp.]
MLDRLLRYEKGYTVKELCDKLTDVDERTVRADLKELEDSSGEYKAVMARNLTRGKKRVWRYEDTHFSIFNSLLPQVEKIRQSIEQLDILKADPRYNLIRYYLLSLEKGLEYSRPFMDFISFDNSNQVRGLNYIDLLLDAITTPYPVKMRYKPFGAPSQALYFHPYHLRQYNKRWFVLGFVEQQESICIFALDRIREAEHLDKPYLENTFNPDAYFKDIVGVSQPKSNEVENVVIKVSDVSYDYILTKPIHASQRELLARKTDKYHFFSLNLKVNRELQMLLFSYGDAIEVLEPAWLRERFRQQVQNLHHMYHQPDGITNETD